MEHRKLSSRADDYNGGFRPGTSQAPFFTAPAHVSRGAVILSTPSPRPSPSLLLHAQVSHLAMPFLAFAADLIPNRLLKLPEAPILGITYFPSASKMFLCFSVTAFNTPRRGRVFPRLPAPRSCAVPAKPMLGLAVSAPGTRPCSAQGRGKKDGFRRQYRPGWKHPERDAPYHGVHLHWSPASSHAAMTASQSAPVTWGCLRVK